MTREELAKALEEYPDKLKAALLRRHLASLKLQEAKENEGASRYSHFMRGDDDYDVERAKIEHSIRTNPGAYGLPTTPRPSDSAVQAALLASPEYAQLRSKKKESLDNNRDTSDSSTVEAKLKAREEKNLADIEVEVLLKTLEAYRILADIMR